MSSLSVFVSELNRGLLSYRSSIVVSSSTYVANILSLLLKEGFVQSFSFCEGKFRVQLRYAGKSSVFRAISVVSKPSRRVYVTREKLVSSYGMGEAVLVSGPMGLFIYRRGTRINTGGEVLLKFL